MPIRPKRKKRAVRAKKLGQQELIAALPPGIGVLPTKQGSPSGIVTAVVDESVDPNAQFAVRMEWDDQRLTAARLYGQGFTRAQISRAMLEHLCPKTSAARNDEQRLGAARTKLRRWEQSQEFRDLIYKHAVVNLDMKTPEILVGLAKRAKRGRVDAARLALEVTGRHTREDAQQPTAVTVNIVGIARPQ